MKNFYFAAIFFGFIFFNNLSFGELSPLENLINSSRVNKQLTPLISNEKLECAAKTHALDIGKSGLCTHIGKDGSNLKARLKACNFEIGAGEELLACKFSTPENALKAWIDSPKQKQFLYSKSFTQIGCSDHRNFYVCILVK